MGINLFNEEGMSMSLWGPDSASQKAGLPAAERKEVTSPNPNPNVFRVQTSQDIGRLSVLKVLYPDATNFEGEKILVLKDRTSAWAIEAQRLDPHFEEDGPVIARFRPDEEGWEDAIGYATYKNSQMEQE